MIPQQYLAMYLGANAVALAVLATAFWRRDVARWLAVAVFAWAAVVNTSTAIANPGAYLDYAALTPSSWYREFILGWFSRHVAPVVMAIATGQLVIAALLAANRTSARWIGAAGAWLFLAAIAPLGVGSGFPFSLTFGAAILVSLEDVTLRSPAFRQLVRLAPRVLTGVLTAFMVLLSLDAFVEGQSTLDTVRGFGLHLIPAGILALAMFIAWRWATAGGLLLFALAIGYGFLADGRVAWMLAISVPLAIDGVLFLWSARQGEA